MDLEIVSNFSFLFFLENDRLTYKFFDNDIPRYLKKRDFLNRNERFNHPETQQTHLRKKFAKQFSRQNNITRDLNLSRLLITQTEGLDNNNYCVRRGLCYTPLPRA